MAGFNRVTLIGNLTRDPQSKALPSGSSLCEFGLAVSRRFKGVTGEDREEVCFLDCTAFGKQADILQEFCRKGRPLFVEGRLKFDTWDDKNGGKRSKVSVVVENFQFLGSRDGNDGHRDEEAGDDRPAVAPRGGSERRQWKPTQNRLFNAGQPRHRKTEVQQSPISADEQFQEADIPF
jgi:single-strand DNA-binding protein